MPLVRILPRGECWKQGGPSADGKQILQGKEGEHHWLREKAENVKVLRGRCIAFGFLHFLTFVLWWWSNNWRDLAQFLLEGCAFPHHWPRALPYICMLFYFILAVFVYFRTATSWRRWTWKNVFWWDFMLKSTEHAVWECSASNSIESQSSRGWKGTTGIIGSPPAEAGSIQEVTEGGIQVSSACLLHGEGDSTTSVVSPFHLN